MGEEEQGLEGETQEAGGDGPECAGTAHENLRQEALGESEQEAGDSEEEPEALLGLNKGEGHIDLDTQINGWVWQGPR